MKTFIYELCQKSITNKVAKHIESYVENKNSRPESNLFMFAYFTASVEDETADNFFKLHHFSKNSSGFNYFFKVIEIFENYTIVNNKLIILYSFLTEFIKKEHTTTSFVFNVDNKRTEHIYQPISFFESLNQIKNSQCYFEDDGEADSDEGAEIENRFFEDRNGDHCCDDRDQYDPLEKIICGSSYCVKNVPLLDAGDGNNGIIQPEVAGGAGECKCGTASNATLPPPALSSSLNKKKLPSTTSSRRSVRFSDYKLYEDELRINKNVKTVDFFSFSKYFIEKFLKRKGFSNFFDHPMMILKKKPLLKIHLNKNDKYVKKKFLEHFFELNEFKKDGLYEIDYFVNTIYIFNNNYDFHIEETNKEMLINKKETIDFLYDYYDIIKCFKTLGV